MPIWHSKYKQLLYICTINSISTISSTIQNYLYIVLSVVLYRTIQTLNYLNIVTIQYEVPKRTKGTINDIKITLIWQQ